MTDELITDLAKISGLRVISHTSVNRGLIFAVALIKT
jgi:TolB-like protein